MEKRSDKNINFSLKSINIINVILILALTIGCNNSSKDFRNEHSNEDIEIQKRAVKNVLINMWAAIENEDIDTYASYIHPEFSQFGEYDSIIKIGKEIEIKGIHEWIKNSSNIHTEMIDPIVIINGNVAWLTYYWSDHGTSNSKPFASKGKSTRIFVKENNDWLCIHGHYTLLP